MDQPIVLPTERSNDGPQKAERIVYPESPRYRRIRFISTLMDQSIVLPTGYRIGLDALVGILPGFGDVFGALVSSYLVYESARLGLRKRVLLQMFGNIILDALFGSIPVAGDLFDAAWKANMRNLRLLDRHYHPGTPERSAWQIGGWFALVFGITATIIGTIFFFVAQFFLAVLNALGII